MKSCSDLEIVEEITDMIDNLSVSMDRRNPFYAQTRETVSVSDEAKWLPITEDHSIREAEIEHGLHSNE